MLYSFMSFSTPTLSLAEMLEAAGRFGYDGIEPRLDSRHAHGIEVDSTPEQRQAAREMVDAGGVRLACLATSLKFADPATAADTVVRAHQRIDLAGDVGAPAIRVFGGAIPEGVSRESAIRTAAEGLADIAAHAAQRDVVVCLETHDDWCDPEHVVAVLERVGHPNIGANWDIMHPVRRAGKSMDEAFHVLRPWVRHLHIHDCVGKDLVPIGTGDIDHRRAAELLLEMGYSGFISGEWIGWEPWEIHLPRELATMRGFERGA